MELDKQVNTAGAFVLVDDLFAFMVGPNDSGDLYVIRLGGHRENNETAIECLERELREEAAVNITPINSPITYYTKSWSEKPSLIKQSFKESISPIIIKGEENGPLSLVYLTYSVNEPIPSSETKGILFLNLEDIDLICNELITIEEFLGRGGKALFQKPLRMDIKLKAGVHLHFLSMVL